MHANLFKLVKVRAVQRDGKKIAARNKTDGKKSTHRVKRTQLFTVPNEVSVAGVRLFTSASDD